MGEDTVFISHSSDANDRGIVNMFAERLKSDSNGKLIATFWSENRPVEVSDWGLIFRYIDIAKFVIVVFTKNVTGKGLAVGQELGYAYKAGKRILSFRTPDVTERLGFIKDTPYSIDSLDVTDEIQKIKGSSSMGKTSSDGLATIVQWKYLNLTGMVDKTLEMYGQIK